MKISTSVFLIATLCYLSTGCSFRLPPKDPKYKMVFNDEFERTYPPSPLNDKKWSRSGPAGQPTNDVDVSWCFPKDSARRFWERAYDIRDAKDTTTVYVSNGTCKILTHKTNVEGILSNWPECDPNRPGYGKDGNKCRDTCYIRGVKGFDTISRCYTEKVVPFKYTTGLLFSREKFFRGYFEIRFRLPPTPEQPYTHEGFGPNFWMYGNNPPANWSSEIDVFEIISYHPQNGDTNMYTSTVHYRGTQHGKKPHAHTEVIGNKLKNDTAWHIAAAWWTEEFVKFYLDDSLYFTVQDIKEVPVEKLAAMNLIIGIASPMAGRCNNFTSYTKFPYVYEIDYVRVYQEKE